jgi:hypothetical protein
VAGLQEKAPPTKRRKRGSILTRVRAERGDDSARGKCLLLVGTRASSPTSTLFAARRREQTSQRLTSGRRGQKPSDFRAGAFQKTGLILGSIRGHAFPDHSLSRMDCALGFELEIDRHRGAQDIEHRTMRVDDFFQFGEIGLCSAAF